MGKRNNSKVVVGEYGVNPFVASLVIDVTNVTDRDSGENYLIECDKSVKTYRGIDNRDRLMSLPVMCNKLLEYVRFKLEPGVDVVRLTAIEFMELTGVKSDKTFYTACIELARAGIISPVAGKKSLYFINPSVIFMGSRINAYPGKVRIVSSFSKK